MAIVRLASNGVPQRSVTVLGYPRLYQPGEIEGAINVGDQRVEILSDELQAAAFGAPAFGQKIIIDGRTTTIQDARPLREGEALIGYSLWVRG